MSKKISEEQLDKVMKAFAGEVSQSLMQIGGDLMKVQNLLYLHLQEEDKLEKIACAFCKNELLRPNIKGIEKSDICPACGKNIFENKQTTFEDWDSGKEEE